MTVETMEAAAVVVVVEVAAMAKTNVTIIYIIGTSPRLVLSPESIRRVGLSTWETKLVIFLQNLYRNMCCSNFEKLLSLVYIFFH